MVIRLSYEEIQEAIAIYVQERLTKTEDMELVIDIGTADSIEDRTIYAGIEVEFKGGE